MTDLPFPLEGTTLITGPSNVGKTRLTAHAVRAWLDRYGPEGVVVFEFGPEFEHEGRVLGRHLTWFEPVPETVWCGVLEAHAPRAAGATTDESVELAADNARRAAQLIEGAPRNPRVVFGNDVTIPFQHDAGDQRAFLAYCDQADCVVLNAFDSGELGTDDPVSRQERAALETFRAWADRTVTLSAD